jgi:hexosaminidase
MKSLNSRSLVLMASVIMLIQVPESQASAPALIPQPARMEIGTGQFTLESQARVSVMPESKEGMAVGDYLAGHLRLATGFPLPVGGGTGGEINLKLDDAAKELGAEGYELAVTPQAVSIRALQPAGLFYGAVTLLQLLPPESFSTQKVHGVAWTLPCVKIVDQPRFGWRGLMLDVSRHFFTKEEVKRLLDQMALHKLNTFHWHLTDGAGWRIEIKKYPELTQIGAWRSGIGFGLDPKASKAYDAKGRYGGFYTQDDIREVVAYAKSRHITIVPEIEMPGHSGAVLKIHPEFSCPAAPSDVYCAGNEEVYAFLDNVLSEVVVLFPGSYVHIGGDEVDRGNWKKCEHCQSRIKKEDLKDEFQLQRYFMGRIEKSIVDKGRKPIGWGEVHEGRLVASAAVMDWIGGSKEAAEAGYEVVMTPPKYCYFDMSQTRRRQTEPIAQPAFVPLRQVYSFEPMPEKLALERSKYILGTQGNIWTEFIPSMSQVEYMTFPRAAALAEVAWSPQSTRDWKDFEQRVTVQEKRYALAGVGFRPHAIPEPELAGEWHGPLTNEFKALTWDVTKVLKKSGDYTADYTHNWGHGAGIAIRSVSLLMNGVEVARSERDSIVDETHQVSAYALKVPAFLPGAKWTLQASVRREGGTRFAGYFFLLPAEPE